MGPKGPLITAGGLLLPACGSAVERRHGVVVAVMAALTGGVSAGLAQPPFHGNPGLQACNRGGRPGTGALHGTRPAAWAGCYHLAVVCGNMPGSATAAAPPQAARLIYRDVPMWALKVLARPVLLRQIGVPKGFPLTAGDARIVADLIDSFFPVALKTEGVTFDAFGADPDVNNYPLEALTVPTLIVHAKDDPLVSYAAAQRVAHRIPDARLVSMERGGHLFLGDREDVGREVAAFLAGPDTP